MEALNIFACFGKRGGEGSLVCGRGWGAGGSERSSSESFAYPINKAQSLSGLIEAEK